MKVLDKKARTGMTSTLYYKPKNSRRYVAMNILSDYTRKKLGDYAFFVDKIVHSVDVPDDVRDANTIEKEIVKSTVKFLDSYYARM